MRDFPQEVKVEDVKAKLSCETSLRARPPSKSESGRCENEAFMRDFPHNLKAEDVKCESEAFVRDLPQNLTVEDVKTKLSCETSSNFESGRCEN